MYFDGIEVGSRVGPRPIQYGAGEGFHIGSMLGERRFEGGIDDVQLYDRVLSPSDIQVLSDL